MKTQLFTWTLFAIGMFPAFGADPLDEIIRYQIKQIRTNDIPVVEYLTYTKPYGKWDSRPVTVSEVSFEGEKIGARSVPNFVWGCVGNGAYHLPEETLSNTPQVFLQYAWSQRASLIETGKNFETALVDLAAKVKTTDARIYVNQWAVAPGTYCRVGNTFREKGEYWSYVKAADWPYFMSTTTEPVVKAFSAENETILSSMKTLGFYAVVQTEEHVVFLIDGVLDNSYGYVVGRTKPSDEKLGHLFHLCDTEKIGETLYLYTSN